MELLSNYFWAAIGIAVSTYVIMNIIMMSGPNRPNVGGWTKNHELWTVKAALIGVTYCFVLSLVTVGVYALLVYLGVAAWICIAVAFVVQVVMVLFGGRIMARIMGSTCPIPQK